MAGTYSTDYTRHVYACLMTPGNTINAREREDAAFQAIANGGGRKKRASAQSSA
jgi:hypothetical protein